MRISFDIDNTIIPYSDEFEVEKNNSILNLISNEKIRTGTVDLFNSLESAGHEIWIYTTSFRPIWKLKLIFWKYGLRPTKFINQDVNLKVLKSKGINASKNPNCFNIDLHVDDSEGVGIEGERYNFRTIIVSPKNRNWVKHIISEVKELNS